MLSLGAVLTVPVTDRILGFAIALFIAANVRDATLRQRLATMALAPFAAFVTTAIAATLRDQPIAAAAVVPPMMFIIAYGAARGPRYGSVGIVALIAYIIAMVARQPPETLPVRFLVLLLAAADAALIRCVVLPERPQAELDRLRHATRAGIGRVLRNIATAVEAGSWTNKARAELHRDIDRLDEVVMLAQSRVAALGSATPGLGTRWLHLLAVELATERVARIALQDLGAAADRGELLATIQAIRNDTETPRRQSTAPLAAALSLLGHVMNEVPRAAPPPAAAPPPVTTAPGLRPAIQTAVAAALAVVSGTLVSPSRWYWAAFAAYVMFQGTRSRGESVAKGVRFIIGTAAGVIAGALLATLLSGNELLTVAVIVVVVFLAFQANIAAFGVMVFWITIILGLMFGMLGYFAPELLLLRLKEAAAGAACGIVVASIVLVRREYSATHDATVAFLRALGQSVASAARMFLDHQPEPELPADILATEQRFRDLDAIAQSEQAAHPLTRNEALHRRVSLCGACEEWARELGNICLQRVELSDPALVRSLRQTVARIDSSVSGLVDSPAARAVVGSTAAEPSEDLGPHIDDDPGQRAVRLLLRIDAALLRLAAG